MHVVLVEPEIPGNTGNISRTCAVTGTDLHLVKPLGFSVDDAHLKRAGLDYWHLLSVHYHDSLEELFEKYPFHKFFFTSVRASRLYSEMNYEKDDFLVFGKETEGLPNWVISKYNEYCIRIPMLRSDGVRSLNLSNSVSVILYEALKQQGFPGLV